MVSYNGRGIWMGLVPRAASQGPAPIKKALKLQSGCVLTNEVILLRYDEDTSDRESSEGAEDGNGALSWAEIAGSPGAAKAGVRSIVVPMMS